MWLSLISILILYFSHLAGGAGNIWFATLAKNSYEFTNIIWKGVLLGIIMVGIISKIPQEFVTAILGRGDNLRGIIRAAFAGVLLDLCSHGILMVGMQLYKRGASIGQVMAFLIASPWNSFSLTLILAFLIGIPWTITFVILSMVVAITTGVIFNYLLSKKQIDTNLFNSDLPENFHFWQEMKQQMKVTKFNGKFFKELTINGLQDSKMVIRWVLFGVIIASLVRASVSLEMFQTYFGATLSGMGMTILVATLLEVCSEGSTPIASDLLTRARAPGNSFAFLMTGVSTDYTEIMSIKDTTRSWKIALLLPMITVPQIIFVGYLINIYSL